VIDIFSVVVKVIDIDMFSVVVKAKDASVHIFIVLGRAHSICASTRQSFVVGVSRA